MTLSIKNKILLSTLDLLLMRQNKTSSDYKTIKTAMEQSQEFFYEVTERIRTEIKRLETTSTKQTSIITPEIAERKNNNEAFKKFLESNLKEYLKITFELPPNIGSHIERSRISSPSSSISSQSIYEETATSEPPSIESERKSISTPIPRAQQQANLTNFSTNFNDIIESIRIKGFISSRTSWGKKINEEIHNLTIKKNILLYQNTEANRVLFNEKLDELGNAIKDAKKNPIARFLNFISSLFGTKEKRIGMIDRVETALNSVIKIKNELLESKPKTISSTAQINTEISRNPITSSHTSQKIVSITATTPSSQPPTNGQGVITPEINPEDNATRLDKNPVPKGPAL